MIQSCTREVFTSNTVPRTISYLKVAVPGTVSFMPQVGRSTGRLDHRSPQQERL